MAVKSLRGHKDNIFEVKWAPDSEHLASCGVDGVIYIWNVFNANPIHVLKGHDNYVNGLVFDPFNKFLASQSNQEKKVIIWKIHDNFTKFTKGKFGFWF
jgi:WD40 repeat protein